MVNISSIDHCIPLGESLNRIIGRTCCRILEKPNLETDLTNTLECRKTPRPKTVLGGGFQYFLFSPRSLGKWNPIWLAHIFQMGWNSTTNWLSLWMNGSLLVGTSIPSKDALTPLLMGNTLGMEVGHLLDERQALNLGRVFWSQNAWKHGFPLKKKRGKRCLILLMVYRQFIPLFIGFHTSQVVQDFSHQQYCLI